MTTESVFNLNKLLRDFFMKEDKDNRYNYFALALAAGLSHLVFGIYWTYVDPQIYESLYLRGMGLLICFMLFITAYVMKYHDSKLPYYFWLFAIVYNLPFFFTVNLILNNFSDIWFVGEATMIAITILFLTNILDSLLVIVIGILSAIIFCLVKDPDSVYFNQQITRHLPIYSLTFISSYIFSYSNSKGLSISKEVKHKQEKKLLTSLSGSIAHELRNPLNTINLSANQLSELASKIDDQELKAKINQVDLTILNSIKQANETINIILADLSEKPVIKDQFSLIKTEKILPEIIDSFGYKTLAEKTKVKLDLKQENNFVFLASPERLTFIVYNLLKNSLYYLKQYPDLVVTVGCEKRKFDNREWNVIYVHDNGPGIHPEVLPKILGDFFSSGKKDGTGLGLAFCKRNMEIFGGKILCESEYGEETNKDSWSKFSLFFPILSQEQINKAELEDRRKKILLVDDQKTNLLATKSRIEKILPNIFCDTALGGEEAIKMARQNRYNLILLDIQMPGVDGVEVSKRIRNLYSETPIIAFTSLEQNEFDFSAFNYYLSKNENNQGFYRSISKWLTDLEDSFSYLGTKEQYSQALQNKKVILADDQQVNRMMTRKILEKNGLIVTEVSDGQELLELYQKSLDCSGKSSFDMVLTDINMPPFNGDEAAKQIRKIELKNNIPHHDEMPIIAISGDGQKEDIHYFFRCQMTDYFIKGTNPEILIKIIANYLTKKTLQQQENLVLANQALEKIEKQITNEEASGYKVLDLTITSSFEKVDQQEILRIFLQETAWTIKKLKEVEKGRNFKEISFLLHSIKGASGNIGAEKLHHYVKEIELIFGSGKLPGNRNWLEELETIYGELKNRVDEALNN